MRTSGHGNDSLIMLVPFGVLVGVGVMLFGGPGETLEVINRIVGDIARGAIGMVGSLFS